MWLIQTEYDNIPTWLTGRAPDALAKKVRDIGPRFKSPFGLAFALRLFSQRVLADKSVAYSHSSERRSGSSLPPPAKVKKIEFLEFPIFPLLNFGRNICLYLC